MNFKPKDARVSDLWYALQGGTAHAFFLAVREGDPQKRLTGVIHHAVSDDLLHWRELQPALTPGAAGEYDDLELWTGCSLWKDGVNYLFYTARSSRDGGLSQSICLATSRDAVHWQKHPGNPILTPDPRFFLSPEHPDPSGTVDCRDFTVVQDPQSGLCYGYYATRLHAARLWEGPAIGVAVSRDLIHWEYCPEPAFVPGRFGLTEVPEVFKLEGRWYMLALVHCNWTNRNVLGDPGLQRGTIYASAVSPAGPFTLGKDYVLSGGLADEGAFCHCPARDGKGYTVLSCDLGPDGTGTISPPMGLARRPGGALRLTWHSATQGYRRECLCSPDMPPTLAEVGRYGIYRLPCGSFEPREDGFYGEAEQGWQHALLDVQAKNIEASARICLAGTAAGLLAGDCAVLLDRLRGELLVGNWANAFREYETRPIDWTDAPHELRCRLRGPRLEVYLDQTLVYQAAAHALGQVRTLGLIVDRGEAHFDQLSAYRLED